MTTTPHAPTLAEVARLTAELDRKTHALRRIVDQAERNRLARPPSSGHSWMFGYAAATAHWAFVAAEALDPEAWAEHEAEAEADARESDRQYFARTGQCGGCGMDPDQCTCTPDHPCGCGPHDTLPWPRPCWHCDGRGLLHKPGGET